MATLTRGLAAGSAATVPMTIAMEVIYRNLPPELRYPLPPRLIAMRLAQEAGVKQFLTPRQRFGVTVMLHFAMGSLAGVAYSLSGAARRKPPNGPAFGLHAWFVNYMVLLPLLRILYGAIFVEKMLSPMSTKESISHHPVRCCKPAE